jgi:hypothetical protein
MELHLRRYSSERQCVYCEVGTEFLKYYINELYAPEDEEYPGTVALIVT